MAFHNNHADSIADGTVLIANNTLLPEPSPQDSVAIGHRWARITNNIALEKKLAAAGWTVFYMAGTIRANVYGVDRARMVQTAVKRLLATAAPRQCNSLEIDEITSRPVLGMIQMVTVSAHSRHIQQEPSFCAAGAWPR